MFNVQFSMFNVKSVIMCTTMFLAGCTAPDMEQQIDELYGNMSQEERIA